MQIEQIPEVVRRLRGGFDSGRTRPLAWREDQLRRFRSLLDEREELFLAALKADLGKPRFEAWLSETGFLRADLEHTLRHLSSWLKPERVWTPIAHQPGSSRVVREPLGLVLIIGPWNYPVQLVLGPLIAAIAAGNAAVVKPSEVAPRSSATLAEWLPRYLDPECFAVVEGGVAETQGLLGERFDHIFYTGGIGVGRLVMEAAARHVTPVTLELGGKSPCLVDREVDLEVAARRITWAKFFNAGQTCVAPDYVLVHRSVEAALLERIRATVREFYGEDPKASTDYGRIINERHFRRLKGLLGSGELVVGGQTDEAERYIAPTVLRAVSPESAVMKEEIFGPILPVIAVDSLDEAIRFVNGREKPLALYVFSRDREAVARVLATTSSGGACVNDAILQLAIPELPFGGVGASGTGAYHGRAGFETFSHRRGVLDHGTAIDLPLRYPPYSEQKLRWARRLV
jgi:aldehyde dehydrogenase (NAD+)